MASNLHWTAANQTRDYPLADNAGAVATNGTRLPPDIIADLSVRYPIPLGFFSFISSVTVTPTLVSVTIQATPGVDASTFAPVAVFSMAQPVEPGVNYAIQPQNNGVGGWIVFGQGIINSAYTGRFTAAAGLLCPRACRGYRLPAVQGISLLNGATALTGIVRLRAQSPLTVTGAVLEVQGVTREVALVQLVQPANATTSVFAELSGPCSARPETGNCGDPQPIQAINAVPPDCDGNVRIELKGLARIAGVNTTDGITSNAVIDTALSLAAICSTAAVPDATGKLPGTYSDGCEETDSVEFDRAMPLETPDTVTLIRNSEGLTGNDASELPKLELFNQLSPGWTLTGRMAFCRTGCQRKGFYADQNRDSEWRKNGQCHRQFGCAKSPGLCDLRTRREARRSGAARCQTQRTQSHFG